MIPSYNGEKTIGPIVKEIRKRGLDVIVIDDGSTDRTEKIASENGALVMRHAENMGKGASLKHGFDYILRGTNFEAVIIMDGDGQHDPGDIEKFITHAEEEDGDIIVGNRMHNVENMPFVRLATNKFMSAVLSAMCRQSIPDTQCGFRLIRRKTLKELKLDSDKYDLESEILIKASRKRLRIESVPIETIYRGESSEIDPVKDTIRFACLIIKSYFK